MSAGFLKDKTLSREALMMSVIEALQCFHNQPGLCSEKRLAQIAEVEGWPESVHRTMQEIRDETWEEHTWHLEQIGR